MAGNLSNYAEKAILEHSVGKNTWQPLTAYVALFSAAPSDTSTGTELSGLNYSRVSTSALTWGLANTSAVGASTISNIVQIQFAPAQGGSWSSATHVGIFDQATGGNLLWHGPLTQSYIISSGERFQFPIGSLTLSID